MVADNVLGHMSALSIHRYPLRQPDATGDDDFTRTFRSGRPAGPWALDSTTARRHGTRSRCLGQRPSLQLVTARPVHHAGPRVQPDRPAGFIDPAADGNTDAVVFDVDVEGGDGYGFGTIASVWNNPRRSAARQAAGRVQLHATPCLLGVQTDTRCDAADVPEYRRVRNNDRHSRDLLGDGSSPSSCARSSDSQITAPAHRIGANLAYLSQFQVNTGRSRKPLCGFAVPRVRIPPPPYHA
jgi:hypothetical protein